MCQYLSPLLVAVAWLPAAAAGAVPTLPAGLTGDPVRDAEILATVDQPEDALAFLPGDPDLAADLISDWLLRQSAATVTSRAAQIPLGAPVLRVGADGACDHGSVQAAINAAANPPVLTVIRIARNAEYTAQQLQINDKDVILEGGYANCGQSQPDAEPTVLDGTGGSNRPVIRIRNQQSGRVMRVDLNNLIIQGGSTTTSGGNCSLSTRNGGGLNIRGRTQVELTRTVVRNNSTNSGDVGFPFCPGNTTISSNKGGGIAIFEGGPDSYVQLNAGSGVLNNRTEGTGTNPWRQGDGGGIYCNTPSQVILADAAVAVGLNSTGGARPGNGGGLYVGFNCSLFSRAGGLFSGIFLNTSHSAEIDGLLSGGLGGGVYRTSTSLPTVFVPAAPGAPSPVVALNGADRDGGGIYFGGPSELRLINTAVVGNGAQGRGAGIFKSGIGELVMARLGACGGGLPLRRCSRLEDNYAIGTGGALYIQRGEARISQTWIGGNRSDNFGNVAYVTGPQTFLLMEGVAIHGNGEHPTSTGLSPRLFFLADQSVTGLRWSTIAGNRNPEHGLIVFAMSNFPDNPAETRLRARGSIIWEPGAGMATTLANTSAEASCLIGHRLPSGFTSDSFYSRIDPGLRDAAEGDFRLKLDSPAIDYCSTFNAGAAPEFRDLFGNLRGVPYPLPTQPAPNPGNGAFDLGVHEQQPADDGIFHDRFEEL